LDSGPGSFYPNIYKKQEDSLTVAEDSRSHACTTKSIVNINYSKTGGTGVQHAQEGGESTFAGTVADGSRDAYYRGRGHAGNHRWQCSFHAGNDNDDLGILEALLMSKYTVQPGNS
jgi:hypothetical protein